MPNTKPAKRDKAIATKRGKIISGESDDILREREKRENTESSNVWKFCCQVVIIYSFFRHQRNNFSKLCGVCKRFGLLTLFFIFIIITKTKSIRR